MRTLTTTEALAEFCQEAAAHPYVTVDTEFLRERTYYAKLCLVQLAFPGSGDENAVLVDPLADGIDLAPLYDLFRDTSVVKVFHAARQDLEIFFVDQEVIPAPLFDTQVAAMVCGFGEQAGYETLVRKIAKAEVDKSSLFEIKTPPPIKIAKTSRTEKRLFFSPTPAPITTFDIMGRFSRLPASIWSKRGTIKRNIRNVITPPTTAKNIG